MNKFTKYLSAAALLAGLAFPALPSFAQKPQDFSGMANLGPKSVVIVCDAKASSQRPRLTIMNITDEGPQYIPVIIENWSADGDKEARPASDLEAICQVPGEPGHYYAFESGYWKGESGRIFFICVKHHPSLGWTGTIEQVLRPFAVPEDGTTSDHEQIEGGAAIKDGQGQIYILMGLRGNAEHAGQLVISKAGEEKMEEIDRREIDLRGFIAGRSCSDLLLYPEDTNKFSIIVSGAMDASDVGPFSSVVCKVGELEILDKGYSLKMTDPQLLYKIDGLKVEALCQTPITINGSNISIGTDSEHFEPIFRPLPANKK